MSVRAPHYPPAAMDLERAADYLSIGVRSLAEIQKAGDLIPKKFGSKRLFLRDDLEEFARRLPDWEREA